MLINLINVHTSIRFFPLFHLDNIAMSLAVTKKIKGPQSDDLREFLKIFIHNRDCTLGPQIG